eukprot:CAMPEP_0202857636 /NCGR_PEP_ID=MMETSP1391-20130828/499_1 /ASSEMBLY_ACC=CAM_ASM_000867 /TAXON_ID=1034604 /ORGANISM="Chlamydomonas leiostraca, Strain SAG 11-49" /LENGTH=372 /DNA_ID=CAMNT_0049536459 /DNA_START=68 /DNA_END=1186 /DNA_ORIENTATION=+
MADPGATESMAAVGWSDFFIFGILSSVAQLISSFFGSKAAREENAALKKRYEETNEALKKLQEEQQRQDAEYLRRQKDTENALKESDQLLQKVKSDLEATQKERDQAQQAFDAAKKAAEEAAKPREILNMPPGELVQRANAALATWGLALDKTRINIAIAGPNGSGKSSLIKAIMHKHGIGWTDPTMPGVSHEAAGTHRPTKYDIPNSPLTLWDMPATNSKVFPAETYHDKLGLAAFHMQILVVRDRLELVHRNLLLMHQEKFPHARVIVVNARADELLKNMWDDEPHLEQSEVMKKIREEHKYEALHPKQDPHNPAAPLIPVTLRDADLFVLSTKLMAGVNKRAKEGLTEPLQEPEFLLELVKLGQYKPVV